jgi:copper chaperone CopZ
MRVANPPRFLFTLTRDVVHAARDEIAARRIWAGGGRAHIEAHGVHHADAPAGYAAALEQAVEAIDGVRWAAANAVLGDVIVDFDEQRVDIEELRRAIARVERQHDMAARPHERLPHPSRSGNRALTARGPPQSPRPGPWPRRCCCAHAAGRRLSPASPIASGCVRAVCLE